MKLQLIKGRFDEFKTIFNYGKNVVASSQGCFGVELLQDKDNPDLVFTFSEWSNQEALDEYRGSEEFRNYWPKIRSLLKEKAEVWSLLSIDSKEAKDL